MLIKTNSGYFAALDPSVYIEIPDAFWSTIISGAFGSILGALAAGGVSYFIFTRTVKIQNDRDVLAREDQTKRDIAALDNQAKRDAELREEQSIRDQALRQFQIDSFKEKEMMSKKAASSHIIYLLAGIISAIANRKRYLDENIIPGAEYWACLKPLIEGDLKKINLNAKSYEYLLALDEAGLADQLEIAIQKYYSMEEAFRFYSKRAMKFREYVANNSEINIKTGEIKSPPQIIDSAASKAKRYELNQVIDSLIDSLQEDFLFSYVLMKKIISAHNAYFKPKMSLIYDIDQKVLVSFGIITTPLDTTAAPQAHDAAPQKAP